MINTGYTRNQQLPFPTSQRVRGNGGADSEKLAVKIDSQLDRVGAQWSALIRPDSAIFQNTSLQTGFIANTPTLLTFITTTVATWGDHPPGNFVSVGFPSAYGWYEVSMTVSSIPSGAVTAGSRRTLIGEVFDASGSAVPIETYRQEDYEQNVGLDTINHVEFVTYLGASFQLAAVFDHGNTGSTVNITTTSTYINLTRITGGI